MHVYMLVSVFGFVGTMFSCVRVRECVPGGGGGSQAPHEEQGECGFSQCVCVCVCALVSVCVLKHKFVRACAFARMSVCVYVCVHVRAYNFARVCEFPCMCEMCVCVCVCVHSVWLRCVITGRGCRPTMLHLDPPPSRFVAREQEMCVDR